MTEINILNSIYSNQKETPREMEEYNDRDLTIKIDDNQELNLLVKNNNSNSEKTPQKNEEDKIWTKSNTYALGERDTSNNELIDNNLKINIYEAKKSKTISEKENVQRINNLKLNNHLETVLETINEISNSKIEASKLSDEPEKDNKNNNLSNNADKDNICKYKKEEASKVNINIDHKIQVSENRINDSENTTSTLVTATGNNTKKPLNFINSVKTEKIRNDI
jgi:hypothetical protein